MARKHAPSSSALPIALSDDVLGMVSGGSGRADFSDLSIMKVTDKASPKLYQACASGKHIPEVSLILL